MAGSHLFLCAEMKKQKHTRVEVEKNMVGNRENDYMASNSQFQKPTGTIAIDRAQACRTKIYRHSASMLFIIITTALVMPLGVKAEFFYLEHEKSNRKFGPFLYEDGSKIQIGKTEFTLVSEVQESPSNIPADSAIEELPGSTGPHDDPAARAKKVVEEFLTWYYERSHGDSTGYGLQFVDVESVYKRGSNLEGGIPLSLDEYRALLAGMITSPLGGVQSMSVLSEDASFRENGEYHVTIAVKVKGKTKVFSLPSGHEAALREIFRSWKQTDEFRKKHPQLPSEAFRDADTFFDFMKSLSARDFEINAVHDFDVTPDAEGYSITYWSVVENDGQGVFMKQPFYDGIAHVEENSKEQPAAGAQLFAEEFLNFVYIESNEDTARAGLRFLDVDGLYGRHSKAYADRGLTPMSRSEYERILSTQLRFPAAAVQSVEILRAETYHTYHRKNKSSEVNLTARIKGRTGGHSWTPEERMGIREVFRRRDLVKRVRENYPKAPAEAFVSADKFFNYFASLESKKFESDVPHEITIVEDGDRYLITDWKRLAAGDESVFDGMTRTFLGQ